MKRGKLPWKRFRWQNLNGATENQNTCITDEYCISSVWKTIKYYRIRLLKCGLWC